MPVGICGIVPILEPLLQLAVFTYMKWIKLIICSFYLGCKHFIGTQYLRATYTILEQLADDRHIHSRCHTYLVFLATDFNSIFGRGGRICYQVTCFRIAYQPR